MKKGIQKKMITLFCVIFIGIINVSATKPIKVLLVTGGCFHAYYYNQTKILVDSINKYVSNIEWDFVIGSETTNDIVPVLSLKNWGKGYDLVIYNMCWGDVMDTSYINNICKNHLEGANAIVLHCTMHTFRDSGNEEWKKFLGIDSHDHAASGIFKVTNVNQNHPIMKDFPTEWITPVEEELYMVNRQFSSVTALATGTGDDKKEYTCFWTNKYGNCNVVGTSVGHANESFQDHDYIIFLCRSVLWLTKNMDAQGKPSNDYWKLGKISKRGKHYKHDEYTIENFENYPNKDSLSKVWSKPPWGNEMQIEIEKGIKSSGKNSLKCQFKTGKEPSRSYALVVRSGKLDLSGYNTIQFWFKPDGSGRQIDIQFTLSSESGENIADYWEASYKTEINNTTPIIVKIPFSEFKQPESSNLNNKNLFFEASQIQQMAVLLRTGEGKTGLGHFYIDDIKAITEIKIPVIIDNFENYSTNAQLEKSFYIPGHGSPIKQSLESYIKGEGKFSMKCEYNITKTKDKFYAPICRVDKWDLTGCNSVQFWIKPDGSGRTFTIEFNIANKQGNNIHDLWEYTVPLQKGDTSAQIITVPFNNLVHKTKYVEAPDFSPVFLPGSLIEVAFYIGSKNDKPGSGIYYIDEIIGTKIKE